MKAEVNGRIRELPDGLTVGTLLDLLGSLPTSVAVARNDRIVRRGEYATQLICDGDRLEIIEAVAGG